MSKLKMFLIVVSGLALFGSGVQAEESADMLQILRQLDAEQKRVKTLRCQWEIVEITQGRSQNIVHESGEVEKNKGGETDLENHCSFRLILSNSNVRCDETRQIWSSRGPGSFVPLVFSWSIVNGTQKDLTASDRKVGVISL